MINIFYTSETNDVAAKKKNKKIADAAKNTIKEYGFIEVYSLKSGQKAAVIKDKEAIIPYWGGVSFELDDEIDPALAQKGNLVNKICFGGIPDPKNPEQEILGIEKILI
jgi:hypothetical protein